MASSGVANGYADGPDEAFADGGFLTGDCGRWDDRGRLSLAGRVSSFVNVAGHKVRPDEVEQVLRAMPGVADVRVIGADDSRRGEQIVACIVAERAGSIPALAVRRFCAARLAPYKIPRAVVFVGTDPDDGPRQGGSRCASRTLCAHNSAYNARHEIAVASECVEASRNRADWGGQISLARPPVRQPACSLQVVPSEVVGGSAAQEPRAHVTTARLAAHDRFALPDLRP